MSITLARRVAAVLRRIGLALAADVRCSRCLGSGPNTRTKIERKAREDLGSGLAICKLTKLQVLAR